MNPHIGKSEQTLCLFTDGVCGLQQSPVPLSVVEQSFFPCIFLQRLSPSRTTVMGTKETPRVYKENQCSS